MKEVTSFEGVHCANCHASLQGEYCHHCGQSVHSVLRPVHGLFEEFFETFLHIDGRILHTLPPLFLKPGFLTLEYFSGRRVRYIAPFRLMFVLCLLSFFALHLATDVIAQRAEQRHQQVILLDKGDDFSDAQTAEKVNKLLNEKIAALEATRAVGNTAIITQVDQTERQLRQEAQQRLAQLGNPASTPTAEAAPKVSIGKPKAAMNPIDIRWLPHFANVRLTQLLEHLRENKWALLHGTETQRHEAWERFASGIYGVLPGTMLVLAPVFALLLKLFYIFKRRLYMEHLIVSLHSHAFLFLSLLLLVITGMLSTWLMSHASWAGYGVSMLQAPLLLWMPTYLLVMQKRVYRQGWTMTIVKFWCIGWLYFWLLIFAISIAAILGLAH